jgi:hypothetical protein
VSEQQSSRQSDPVAESEFALKMKDIKNNIEEIKRNNVKILRMKEKITATAMPQK